MKPNIELAIAKVAASQHGLIARRQDLDLGATAAEIKYRIKTHRWELVHRSVYRLAGVPNSWRQSLQALCLVSASFVASHRSAGRLWGLPDLKGDWLEVSAPRGCSFRHPGIWVHESLNLTAADLTCIDGVPVTTPARTLIDLGSVLSAELTRRQLTTRSGEGLSP